MPAPSFLRTSPKGEGTGPPVRGGGVGSWLPWTDGSGRAWPGWSRLPLAAPFVGLYLAVCWALFLPMAERESDRYFTIDIDPVRGYLFHIPHLSQDPVGAVRDLVTAPVLNHDSVQIVYVTILLMLFGVVFELKEGTPATAALFFGTTMAAAVGAGVLLHLVYPEVWDGRFFERAWERTWSGGSAGCFGLMGALAARARRPWLLLGLFATWEIGVAVFYLKNYTSAFHLTALATGFLAVRYAAAWRAARPVVTVALPARRKSDGRPGARSG